MTAPISRTVHERHHCQRSCKWSTRCVDVCRRGRPENAGPRSSLANRRIASGFFGIVNFTPHKIHAHDRWELSLSRQLHIRKTEPPPSDSRIPAPLGLTGRGTKAVPPVSLGPERGSPATLDRPDESPRRSERQCQFLPERLTGSLVGLKATGERRGAAARETRFDAGLSGGTARR
jgi:hypothetical protein